MVPMAPLTALIAPVLSRTRRIRRATRFDVDDARRFSDFDVEPHMGPRVGCTLFGAFLRLWCTQAHHPGLPGHLRVRARPLVPHMLLREATLPSAARLEWIGSLGRGPQFRVVSAPRVRLGALETV